MISKILTRAFVPIAAFFVPLVVFAQAPNPTYIDALFTDILGWLNALVPIMIAAALVYFFYGLIRFVLAEDAATKAEARGVIIYGIIILFVMVAVWSIVTLVIIISGVGVVQVPPMMPAIPTNG